MKKIVFFILFLCLNSSITLAQRYEVKVHPGTELMHIVNYLAGVYGPAVSGSTYQKDVDQWFSKYKDHPAVTKASELPYNDFVDLGWCIEYPSMKLTYPEDYGYFSMMKPKQFLEEYLRLCHQFAIDSDFKKFYQQQRVNYERWEKQFIFALQRDKPLDVLENFYQVSIDKQIYFSISPIGVVLRANIDLKTIAPPYAHIAPIIIPYDERYIDTKSKEPNFAYNSLSLNNNVWHEASHIYWEEISKEYKEQLLALKYKDTLSSQIKVFDDERLNLYFFIHEVVSDAVAIYLKMKLIDEEAAKKHLLINEQAGSPLYRKVVNLYDQYWQNRTKRNFKDFIPDIINTINE